MNVEKYINSIKTRVQTKIDKLYDEANEAYGSWADTGYSRYMTKKERLEDEAYQLERFINPDLNWIEKQERIRQLQEENDHLVMLMKKVKNITDDMKFDLLDSSATRRLESVVDEFKHDILSRKGLRA